MAEGSRRAARRPQRGGLPNALFVVAAAEALPPELDGLADLVCVHFPWGSLLRGLLAADPVILTGLPGCCAPGEPCRCWCPRPTATGRPGSTRVPAVVS